MRKNRELRAFDLYCGAGGSSCGAAMAGVTPVGGIDISQTAIDTYELNYPDAQTYCRNINYLTAKSVGEEVGQIDLLLASPECTNHSVARGKAKGKKKQSEDSRRTAYQVIRFAKAMEPRWIVVENVTSMRKWTCYSDWLAKLKKVGYQAVETTLNANDFGVAQNRRRLFVICDREKKPALPSRSRGRKPTVKSILASPGVNGFNWGFSPLLGHGRARPTLARARRAKKAIGNDKPFLIVYYGGDSAGGWQSLDRPLRTITTLDRFALVKPNGDGHEMRMLQPPELSAAMGFPDNYEWPDTTRRNRIKLIGNAVSPPVMRAIVESLMET